MEEKLFSYRKSPVSRLLVCGLAMTALAGCSDRMPTTPVEGKVLYQGKPLEFGSVLFQPDKGPLARGVIASDGTFRLSTYTDGDGAVVGQHRVQIVCCEFQRPGSEMAFQGEPDPGPSFIPEKYGSMHSSGLQVDVKLEGNEPLVFDLK